MINGRIKFAAVLSAFVLLGLSVLGSAVGAQAPSDGPNRAYDLVIINGRVIDPETGLNEVAAVAIKDGTIVKVTTDPEFRSSGASRVIDAAGQVVSPGFINTHTHEGMGATVEETLSPNSMIMAHDGVTFWLGGNCGMSPTGIRIKVAGFSIDAGMPDLSLGPFLDKAERVPLYSNYATLTGNITLRSAAGVTYMQKETNRQIEKMKQVLARDMEAGSFGVSSGLMYDMGASRKAMLELAKVSKQHGGMAASHTRYPTFNFNHLTGGKENVVLKRSIYEAIDTCREAEVPFIVSHITDMSQADSSRWAFATIDKAIREEGLPLAGDIIGHDFLTNDFFLLTFFGTLPVWFMTTIGDYDMDQFYAGDDVYLGGKLYLSKYEQVSVMKAEWLRLNVLRIDGLLKDKRGMPLICKIIPPEDTKLGLTYPWVFMGNDAGGKAVDPETGEFVSDMPRALGTFSQLLGRWSREEGAISLEQAVFKATIAPALWLGLDKKGRIQEGCDADIVIFNPDTIIHKNGWLDNMENNKPEGISHVIVAGQVVVENNEVTGATPGRIVRRTWEIPGDTGAVLRLYEERFGK